MTDENDSAERIRVRAYELYVERGANPGRAEEDWLQAERELLVGERAHTPADATSLGVVAEPTIPAEVAAPDGTENGAPNGGASSRARKADSGRRARRP